MLLVEVGALVWHGSTMVFNITKICYIHTFLKQKRGEGPFAIHTLSMSPEGKEMKTKREPIWPQLDDRFHFALEDYLHFPFTPNPAI